MSIRPSELRQAAEQIEKGETASVSVRELLSWFGYERRGRWVINEIRSALHSLHLVTSPDFEFEWIDGMVHLRKRKEVSEESDASEPAGPSDEAQVAVTNLGGAVEDPTYRLGKLDAANRPPISVPPDAPLNRAVTIMLREDFSQLPVMTSERDVKGAITWRTIGSRLAFGKECKTVRDCMDVNVEIVASDVSLFRVIEVIANQDFILVRDRERKISGIVTAADLAESFHALGRPFLLLSEIENHLRGIIDGKFEAKEIQEARNPGESDREITSVSDLTFGEYVRLLQDPDKWRKVGLNVDRATFIKDLERVNLIRNDVMHFDPDGIGNEDLEFLGKEARFLQELREISRA